MTEPNHESLFILLFWGAICLIAGFGFGALVFQ